MEKIDGINDKLNEAFVVLVDMRKKHATFEAFMDEMRAEVISGDTGYTSIG